jgi:glutamate racemase
MHNGPIGFFDSGVGGLTIWKAVVALLPNESTIYLADSAHAPYGEKTPEAIYERSRIATQFLISKGCKLIVVACNTATTNAVALLRQNFEVPFIGIEPAVKPAALSTKTKSIGVLATKGTLTSALFKRTAAQYAETHQINIVERVGEGLVPLIENPHRNEQVLREKLDHFIAPMRAAGVDFIVLGCTHYPLIAEVIQEIAGPNIALLDAADPVAKQTKRVLLKHQFETASAALVSHQFFTTGNPSDFDGVLMQLGGVGFPPAIRVGL